MALRTSPTITAQLGKLSLSLWIGGGSSSVNINNMTPSGYNTIIKRLAHTRSRMRKLAKEEPPKPPTQLQKKKRKGERIEPSFEPGHGEKIYVFNHFLDGMTVYSHEPVMKASRALKQIPFNGKKLKPAKLRKDYWRPMALIQFPAGQSAVGRSVYQRLRECKRLHELAWDDATLYDRDTGRTLTRLQRGRRLNDQKANTVADMAFVLGGAGKGNKMWVSEDAGLVESSKGEVDAETPDAGAVVKTKTEEGLKSLVKATVWWRDELDRNHAREWPDNVTHQLFEEAQLVPIEVEEAAAEELDGGDGGGEGGEKPQRVPTELVAEQELVRGSGQSQRL
ncbi:Uu.00g058390.m01.CDS01 [Anthostomella pinea]|uniref:Large ribosomal subunit protein mL67 n=1 Tax=Anthostomella pinea TaxID=933095 RepID=A0AAI8VSI0_9PEZI|nr:Uu.00g058390.m01.CDS01 [Anthostomella pinea]